MICMCFTTAIAIKESVHVGDKTQKRLARGVDDLGIYVHYSVHTQVHVLYHRQVISVFVWKFDGVFLLNGHMACDSVAVPCITVGGTLLGTGNAP